MGAQVGSQKVGSSDCGEQVPDNSNACNNAGDVVNLDGFCTLAGSAGDNYRSQFCEQKGSINEWAWDEGNRGSSCTYNDCNNYSNMSNHSCCIGTSGCCSIAGSGAGCKRTGFNGDPIQCCLNDNACSTDPNSCWTDGSAQRNTCNPGFRDITSIPCQGRMLTYCSGADLIDPTDSSWINRWIDSTGKPLPQGCYRALQRNLYTSPTQPCYAGPQVIPPTPGNTCIPAPANFNAEGLAWAQQLMQAVLAKYASNGFSLGSLPGTAGYSPFQDFIYNNICCPYPALCQKGLNGVCANMTAQRLTLNPTAVNWCGCHLPAGEYAKYVNTYQINKECTPMCNKAGVIPTTDANNNPIQCNQGVCLIDNVTIDLSQSKVSGAINIGQLCSNCASAGSCSCIIENDSFISANSSFSGNIDLAQHCTSSTCSRTNPIPGASPAYIPVPCTEPSNYNPLAQQAQELSQAATRRKIEIGAVILIIVVAVVIALLAISPWIL